ncbi:MAG: hypothetical protein PUP91_13685 [Rhizonema sp. PD37]|nr:hypothetical protein [Rhizonema sp. PD37]
MIYSEKSLKGALVMLTKKEIKDYISAIEFVDEQLGEKYSRIATPLERQQQSDRYGRLISTVEYSRNTELIRSIKILAEDLKTHIPHFKMQYINVSNNITKTKGDSQY